MVAEVFSFLLHYSLDTSTRVTGSSFIPGQIAVYEAFFDIGFRGVIPVLVASLCDFFGISPSQLNPPSWRLLVAIQNLGDLENLSFGINEVMFSYHLAPLNGNEGRLQLRPRSGLPIVEELQKGDRKGSAFSKKWQEQYVFVMLPGHSYHWTFLGRSRGYAWFMLLFDPLTLLLCFQLECTPFFRRERIPFFEHASFLLIVLKYLAYLVTARYIVAACGVSVF